MADKPNPVAYNLADVKPPKDLREPLKSALPYVQILIADGKIKAPKPKEDCNKRRHISIQGIL